MSNIFGMSPQFEHDCDHCTFITRIVYQDQPADLYVHLRVHANAPEDVDTYDLNTVIRTSDTDSDYTSWTESGVKYTESWPTPIITDPFGDEAAFEPMAEWEMELVMDFKVLDFTDPMDTKPSPFPVSGDLLAKARANKKKG